MPTGGAAWYDPHTDLVPEGGLDRALEVGAFCVPAPLPSA